MYYTVSHFLEFYLYILISCVIFSYCIVHLFRILDKINYKFAYKAYIKPKTIISKFDKPYIPNLEFSCNLKVIVS